MGGGTGLFGNSRLGRAKFPFRAGTGIGSQEFDLARWFRGGMAAAEGKMEEIPDPTGITGNPRAARRSADRGDDSRAEIGGAGIAAEIGGADSSLFEDLGDCVLDGCRRCP